MRNENERKKSIMNYLPTFALVLIAIGAIFFNLGTYNKLEEINLSNAETNLSNFKSGLEVGHLIGYLETQSLDYDEMDEISVKYAELKSASSISEAQEIADEISILLQNMYDQLEKENNELEKEHEILLEEQEQLLNEQEALLTETSNQ